MIMVSNEDFQSNVSRYMKQVGRGETLILTQENIPVAELKPLPHLSKQLRPIGLCTGEFVVPDDFDAPLSEELLQEFEGK